MSAESFGSAACPSVPEVTVLRPIFRLEQVQQSCGYVNNKESSEWIVMVWWFDYADKLNNQQYLLIAVVQKVIGRFKELNNRRTYTRVFPFLSWIQRYSLRRDLPLDVISGCTVAIMHIPQGEKKRRRFIVVILWLNPLIIVLKVWDTLFWRICQQ